MASSNTARADSFLTFERLRLFNAVMALAHLVQGIAILLLSENVSVPITSGFLALSPESQRLEPRYEMMFDLELAPLVASFALISALAHGLLAGPLYGWYVANLKRGTNYARWWEYAASASIMIVLIGVLAGVYDVGSLILMFSLNAMMIFSGLVMESVNRERSPVNWTPFLFGCFAGAVPWVVIGIYLISPGQGGDPPGFVYGIFFSLFVFFNCFAVNMWLQYRKIGPWRNYLFGELVYVLLSLTAKSALLWQVFFGTLTSPI